MKREGSRVVKHRFGELLRDLSQGGMLASVPVADVIISIASQLAVALKFDAEQGVAPMLLAMGTD
ncbi:EscU/YscU/HrcU family type III secretion system export apparatus switch protein, partial [Pseudomonas syringae pv. tagetis]|uniref:EscU/YscU/HrcU family type III secretion system export apparatus switch protein n=1 Tax=Pseudomonas syringae group genomosp. 7 TaxID=251699 RepID=UPI0037706F59